MEVDTDFTCEIDDNAVLMGRACDRQGTAELLVHAADIGGQARAKALIESWLETGWEAIRDHVGDEAARRFLIDLLQEHYRDRAAHSAADLAVEYAADEREKRQALNATL